jgi:hypothetical protein
VGTTSAFTRVFDALWRESARAHSPSQTGVNALIARPTLLTLSGVFDLVRTDEKIGRNFPRS